MKINNDKDMLSLLNSYNLIPTRKDKRDLIQGYYSNINLYPELCEGNIQCSTRPLSLVEILLDSIYQLSEIFLTNQLEQALVKSKLGKVKICDYDNTMNIHYWVQHLSIFYQDILSFSNTCECIDNTILERFKDKYKIDCILENMSCKKDGLALLYNQIYKVFLSKIPKCDTKLSLSWDDEYYCVCDAEQLLPIVINSIIPTYRTLQIDWTHTATGILYLVEVLDYEIQELVASDITSNKQIEIFGLVPNKEYTVRISASNCKSTVSTSQNQETLPIFITVNLIDNRANQISTDYNISFLGTRQLDENELFVLDFSFLNILQQTLDVITPNKYSYFSKIILSNIENSQTIFVNNQVDSKLTKLDYYLGLLTQGRFKIQPLINTTIDIYLDEITYQLDEPTCDINNTLIYNNLLVYNTESNITVNLPSLLTTILNTVNTNTSELFISESTAQLVLDSYQEINSSTCCKDSILVPSNIFVTNITDNSFTLNFTPNPNNTTTLTIEDNNGIVFQGTIGSGTNTYTVNQQVGITYSTEYTCTITVNNCTGTIEESIEVTTNSIINTAQLFVRGGSGAVYNIRSSSSDVSYLTNLPVIDSWTSSINVSCLENYAPYTSISKIYNNDILNTTGFNREIPNTGIGNTDLTIPFKTNIGKGTFACCTPNLTPWHISNVSTTISAVLDNTSNVSQYIFSGKFLGIRPIPRENSLRLEIIISTNSSGGHAIASDMELYLLIDGVPVMTGVQFNLAAGYTISGLFHLVPYEYSPLTAITEGVIEAYVLIRGDGLEAFNPLNKSGIKIWYQIIKN